VKILDLSSITITLKNCRGWGNSRFEIAEEKNHNLENRSIIISQILEPI
jgi:hypothetical protein